VRWRWAQAPPPAFSGMTPRFSSPRTPDRRQAAAFDAA
jgi:hypothetical protein